MYTAASSPDCSNTSERPVSVLLCCDWTSANAWLEYLDDFATGNSWRVSRALPLRTIAPLATLGVLAIGIVCVRWESDDWEGFSYSEFVRLGV